MKTNEFVYFGKNVNVTIADVDCLIRQLLANIEIDDLIELEDMVSCAIEQLVEHEECSEEEAE